MVHEKRDTSYELSKWVVFAKRNTRREDATKTVESAAKSHDSGHQNSRLAADIIESSHLVSSVCMESCVTKLVQARLEVFALVGLIPKRLERHSPAALLIR